MVMVEQDTAFRATGVISFKDDTIEGGDPSESDQSLVGDEFKPKGAQDMAAFQNDSCYYWDGLHSTNAAGDTITAEDFASLEFKGVQRHADGSIDLQGFLELKK